ncbi:BZ3500_MvSof-1268-A1-R1_Chr8-1g10027 [Microbotryum saponariae]|uniref:BZ3500_MvSof-1268-A1-R1_Chr8-1g10027 protein n=1 Tax=Microbotryum saponariae TaxID=289078 RepID=A0A2X0MU98_9BASI|nr:BZ3500_MvSof-1268-A1-R1_Chr8-1g10027 [Microbotryum saponariae]SDA08313.1 BZ3501_MvSof-1269-A2-R1_Chr8-1g09750 [Microbotryum saponariae]
MTSSRPTRRSTAASAAVATTSASGQGAADDSRKVARRSSSHRSATAASSSNANASTSVAASAHALVPSSARRLRLGDHPDVGGSSSDGAEPVLAARTEGLVARRLTRKAPISPKSSRSTSPQLSELYDGSYSPDVDAPPYSPPDRLTHLSSELLALILAHLSPKTEPDLSSLYRCALVCKGLLPHVRLHMYRDLRIDTRVHAHAMHRTLHGNDVNRAVKTIVADVGMMAKTSSQWVGEYPTPEIKTFVSRGSLILALASTGWFLFHSMHSLCGIIGSCRTLLSLTICLPAEATAWTQSLCSALVDLKMLHTLVKDLDPSREGAPGVGRAEGMDVGWRPRKSTSMWSVSQLLKPLASLRSLTTLRLCGISSDSSTNPPTAPHQLRLTEVVLIEVNITNTDLLHLLGNVTTLRKLTLWCSSLLSKRGLTHVLKRCPNLVELRVGGSWFGAKDEDDTNFPLDASLASLPRLRVIHVSGSLISPAILLLPSTNLEHLLVHGAPAFTPLAIHSALARMRSDPSPIARLTLPEMVLQGEGAHTSSGGRQKLGSTCADVGWTEHWLFTVKATAQAKGVILENGREGMEGREDDLGDDSGSDRG